MSGFDRSPELDQLAAALALAQAEFEPIAKSSVNPFFKSHYADLPSIVQAAAPVLAKHGLSVCQLPGYDNQDDTLTTILLHKSGQFLAGTLKLRPVKNDPQAQGSATTYGRRYSLMSALGLVAGGDDDDGAAASQPPARQRAQAAESMSRDQYQAIVAEYANAGTPVNEFAGFLGCDATAEGIAQATGTLTSDRAVEALEFLRGLGTPVAA